MTRTRVAALMDTGIVSGPGRQLAALIAPLAARGIELRPVCFQRRDGPRTPYMDFLTSTAIPFDTVTYAGRLDPRLLMEVRSALREFAPQIVQTHSYRPTVLASVLRAGGAPWKWVGFFHGITNEDLKVRVYHWLDRMLLPRADRVIVMAQSQRARFGERAHVQQLYNAVLPAGAAVPSPEVESQLEALDGRPRPRIGVIGRLSHEKGVDVLLDAFALLVRRSAAGVLVVAGDGPERAALERQAESLGIADRLAFLGTVLPVEPLYPLLDAVVIPSRSEGLPNVLLEAFRADVPVVATRVGAVPELLEGSAAGVMVPRESPKALAEGLHEVLCTGRSEGARAARAALAKRFSLEARVEAHVRLYHEVLAA